MKWVKTSWTGSIPANAMEVVVSALLPPVSPTLVVEWRGVDIGHLLAYGGSVQFSIIRRPFIPLGPVLARVC